MKLSIIHRWKLMRVLEDRGPHWSSTPGQVEEAETRAYRRDIARVDEVLRQEVRALDVQAPAHVERLVMAAVRSGARAERIPHTPLPLRDAPLPLHPALVLTAASIILFCVWAWSRSVPRSATAPPLATREAARDSASFMVGGPELTGTVIRTQLCALDKAVEEPLRSEVRHIRRDARAMAANTASWLPKPWFALLTGERAAPQ